MNTKTSTNEKETPARVGSADGSVLLPQIDALISELMNHHKYPSDKAYFMACKLRHTLLSWSDAPSPNTRDEARG